MIASNFEAALWGGARAVVATRVRRVGSRQYDGCR